MPSPLLPASFVERWNAAARDGEIEPREVSWLVDGAKETPAKTDDRFLADLLEASAPGQVDFERLRQLMARGAEAGLQTAALRIQMTLAGGEERTVELFHSPFARKIQVKAQKPGSLPYQEHDQNIGLDEASRYTGFGGGGLGYQFARWSLEGKRLATTHGLHVDTSLVSSRLAWGVLVPAIRFQANLGFPNVAFSPGLGPVVHLGLPPFLHAYGGLLASAHFASIGEHGRNGWSTNAVAGGQLFILYAEGVFPLQGGAFRQTAGFSAGLRFGL